LDQPPEFFFMDVRKRGMRTIPPRQGLNGIELSPPLLKPSHPRRTHVKEFRYFISRFAGIALGQHTLPQILGIRLHLLDSVPMPSTGTSLQHSQARR
jgi:hypothetical protein